MLSSAHYCTECSLQIPLLWGKKGKVMKYSAYGQWDVHLPLTSVDWGKDYLFLYLLKYAL